MFQFKLTIIFQVNSNNREAYGYRIKKNTFITIFNGLKRQPSPENLRIE
jgi:hypothetical protein